MLIFWWREEKFPCCTDQINTYQIPYGNGGIDFEAAFRQADNVANNHIHQETIGFIFMINGGATYHSNSIALFQ